jgi:hypothetical protein
LKAIAAPGAALHLVRAAPVLGRELHVEHESSGRFEVLAGNNHDGQSLCGEPEIHQPHSLGWGLIDQVEDLLFDGTGASEIQEIVVGEIYDLHDSFFHFSSRVRLRLAQSNRLASQPGSKQYPVSPSSASLR